MMTTSLGDAQPIVFTSLKDVSISPEPLTAAGYSHRVDRITAVPDWPGWPEANPTASTPGIARPASAFSTGTSLPSPKMTDALHRAALAAGVTPAAQTAAPGGSRGGVVRAASATPLRLRRHVLEGRKLLQRDAMECSPAPVVAPVHAAGPSIAVGGGTNISTSSSLPVPFTPATATPKTPVHGGATGLPSLLVAATAILKAALDGDPQVAPATQHRGHAFPAAASMAALEALLVHCGPDSIAGRLLVLAMSGISRAVFGTGGIPILSGEAVQDSVYACLEGRTGTSRSDHARGDSRLEGVALQEAERRTASYEGAVAAVDRFRQQFSEQCGGGADDERPHPSAPPPRGDALSRSAAWLKQREAKYAALQAGSYAEMWRSHLATQRAEAQQQESEVFANRRDGGASSVRAASSLLRQQQQGAAADPILPEKFKTMAVAPRGAVGSRAASPVASHGKRCGVGGRPGASAAHSVASPAGMLKLAFRAWRAEVTNAQRLQNIIARHARLRTRDWRRRVLDQWKFAALSQASERRCTSLAFIESITRNEREKRLEAERLATADRSLTTSLQQENVRLRETLFDLRSQVAHLNSPMVVDFRKPLYDARTRLPLPCGVLRFRQHGYDASGASGGGGPFASGSPIGYHTDMPVAADGGAVVLLGKPNGTASTSAAAAAPGYSDFHFDLSHEADQPGVATPNRPAAQGFYAIRVDTGVSSQLTLGSDGYQKDGYTAPMTDDVLMLVDLALRYTQVARQVYRATRHVFGQSSMITRPSECETLADVCRHTWATKSHNPLRKADAVMKEIASVYSEFAQCRKICFDACFDLRDRLVRGYAPAPAQSSPTSPSPATGSFAPNSSAFLASTNLCIVSDVAEPQFVFCGGIGMLDFGADDEMMCSVRSTSQTTTKVGGASAAVKAGAGSSPAVQPAPPPKFTRQKALGELVFGDLAGEPQFYFAVCVAILGPDVVAELMADFYLDHASVDGGHGGLSPTADAKDATSVQVDLATAASSPNGGGGWGSINSPMNPYHACSLDRAVWYVLRRMGCTKKLAFDEFTGNVSSGTGSMATFHGIADAHRTLCQRLYVYRAMKDNVAHGGSNRGSLRMGPNGGGLSKKVTIANASSLPTAPVSRGTHHRGGGPHAATGQAVGGDRAEPVDAPSPPLLPRLGDLVEQREGITNAEEHPCLRYLVNFAAAVCLWGSGGSTLSDAAGGPVGAVTDTTASGTAVRVMTSRFSVTDDLGDGYVLLARVVGHAVELVHRAFAKAQTLPQAPSSSSTLTLPVLSSCAAPTLSASLSWQSGVTETSNREAVDYIVAACRHLGCHLPHDMFPRSDGPTSGGAPGGGLGPIPVDSVDSVSSASAGTVGTKAPSRIDQFHQSKVKILSAVYNFLFSYSEVASTVSVLLTAHGLSPSPAGDLAIASASGAAAQAAAAASRRPTVNPVPRARARGMSVVATQDMAAAAAAATSSAASTSAASGSGSPWLALLPPAPYTLQFSERHMQRAAWLLFGTSEPNTDPSAPSPSPLSGGGNGGPAATATSVAAANVLRALHYYLPPLRSAVAAWIVDDPLSLGGVFVSVVMPFWAQIAHVGAWRPGTGSPVPVDAAATETASFSAPRAAAVRRASNVVGSSRRGSSSTGADNGDAQQRALLTRLPAPVCQTTRFVRIVSLAIAASFEALVVTAGDVLVAPGSTSTTTPSTLLPPVAATAALWLCQRFSLSVASLPVFASQLLAGIAVRMAVVSHTTRGGATSAFSSPTLVPPGKSTGNLREGAAASLPAFASPSPSAAITAAFHTIADAVAEEAVALHQVRVPISAATGAGGRYPPPPDGGASPTLSVLPVDAAIAAIFHVARRMAEVAHRAHSQIAVPHGSGTTAGGTPTTTTAVAAAALMRLPGGDASSATCGGPLASSSSSVLYATATEAWFVLLLEHLTPISALSHRLVAPAGRGGAAGASPLGASVGGSHSSAGATSSSLNATMRGGTAAASAVRTVHGLPVMCDAPSSLMHVWMPVPPSVGPSTDAGNASPAAPAAAVHSSGPSSGSWLHTVVQVDVLASLAPFHSKLIAAFVQYSCFGTERQWKALDERACNWAAYLRILRAVFIPVTRSSAGPPPLPPRSANMTDAAAVIDDSAAALTAGDNAVDDWPTVQSVNLTVLDHPKRFLQVALAAFYVVWMHRGTRWSHFIDSSAGPLPSAAAITGSGSPSRGGSAGGRRGSTGGGGSLAYSSQDPIDKTRFVPSLQEYAPTASVVEAEFSRLAVAASALSPMRPASSSASVVKSVVAASSSSLSGTNPPTAQVSSIGSPGGPPTVATLALRGVAMKPQAFRIMLEAEPCLNFSGTLDAIALICRTLNASDAWMSWHAAIHRELQHLLVV